MRTAVLTALVLGLFPIVASAAPVAPEDLFKMTFLSSALISPDGTHVLVESSRMNGPKDTYDRTIDLVDVATGTLTHNVTKHLGDGDYDWMRDGRSFVFVRTLEKQKPQLYRYTLADGTVVQLTHIKDGISAPVVSHAGDRIALTVTETDPAHDAYVDFKNAGFTPASLQKKSDVHVIDQLFFETNGQGDTYRDHQHIWTVDANGLHPAQLTSGRYSEGFDAWSPDDKTILFDSLRYESVDSGPSDVYAIPSTGGAMQKLTSTLPANNGLFFGADGQRVYYFSGDVKDAAQLPALVSAKSDGSDPRVIVTRDTVSYGDTLLADMKEGGGLCGSPLPAGSLALLNIDGPGYANLRTLDLNTGALKDITPPRGEAWSCSVSRDGQRIAYLYSDFTHPADVYVADVSGGAPRQLTHVNDAYLASVTLSQPVELTVKDPAGFAVQAWFMPAIGGKPHSE